MAFDIMFRQLLPGMGASVSIFVLTLLFSLPLGLLVAFARMSKIKPLQWITKFYISIMRGTPLMLQLLVVYFGPYYVFRQNISTEYRFYATIIGFSINYASHNFPHMNPSVVRLLLNPKTGTLHVLLIAM